MNCPMHSSWHIASIAQHSAHIVHSIVHPASAAQHSIVQHTSYCASFVCYWINFTLCENSVAQFLALFVTLCVTFRVSIFVWTTLPPTIWVAQFLFVVVLKDFLKISYSDLLCFLPTVFGKSALFRCFVISIPEARVISVCFVFRYLAHSRVIKGVAPTFCLGGGGGI